MYQLNQSKQITNNADDYIERILRNRKKRNLSCLLGDYMRLRLKRFIKIDDFRCCMQL